MQGKSVEIVIPYEILQHIRRDMSREERQALQNDREPFHTGEAQLLLEEAIIPWYAETQGMPPEQADYDLSGEIVIRRDENGRFSEN